MQVQNVTISGNTFNNSNYGIELMSVPSEKNTSLKGISLGSGNKTTDVLITNNKFNKIKYGGVKMDGVEDSFVTRVDLLKNNFGLLSSTKKLLKNGYASKIKKDF